MKNEGTSGLSRLLCRRGLPSVGLSNYGARSTMMPSPREANRPSSIKAGNFTHVKEIHEIRAQECRRPKTTTLGRTGLPLEFDWVAYMGQAMEQGVPDMCGIVACTVWLEAVHRIECENLHGHGAVGFPPSCDRLVSLNMMRNLFIDCVQDGIWEWGEGAYVGAVLAKIKQMRGLVAFTDYSAHTLTLEKHVLPLRSWEMHWWGHYNGSGLSPKRVAELLVKGPCIGTLFVVDAWYDCIDAEEDEERVYTSHGCGRSDDIRRLSEDLFPADEVGWHAVVCVGYRFRDGRMHVRVLDNHTPRGPWRWVRLEEFYMMYTGTSLGEPPSGRHGHAM